MHRQRGRPARFALRTKRGIQRTVHVNDIRAPGFFMQIVDVLSHQKHVARILLLQPGQSLMGRIGDCLGRLTAAGIVEIDHQLRIACITFRGCDVFDPMLRPKPAFIPKRTKTAFSRNACASKNDNIGHDALPLVFALQMRHGKVQCYARSFCLPWKYLSFAHSRSCFKGTCAALAY